MPDKKPYWKLFASAFSISAVTFGGGYVIVPIMQRRFVEKYKWIEKDEMLELVAIAQSSPGAIAINCATLVGHQVAGFRGALCSLLGTALPPLIILSAVSFFYSLLQNNIFVAAAMKGMQAGIAAIIADVVFDMAKVYFKKDKLPSLLIMLLAFTATWFFGVNVAYIILASALFGVFMTLIQRKKGESR